MYHIVDVNPILFAICKQVNESATSTRTVGDLISSLPEAFAVTTRAELAKRSGKSPNTVKQYLSRTAKNPCPYEFLRIISELLNITIDDIIDFLTGKRDIYTTLPALTRTIINTSKTQQ